MINFLLIMIIIVVIMMITLMVVIIFSDIGESIKVANEVNRGEVIVASKLEEIKRL